MMSKIVSLRLVEEDDEDTDLGKEVGDTYPPFQFQRFGSANGTNIYLVHAGDEFIGSLKMKHNGLTGEETWAIGFIKSQERHTHIPVTSKEEGAQLLWKNQMGIIQLPNNPPYHEPLQQIPDDPDHYENVQKTAHNLVKFLSEEEDEDEDDFDNPKDVSLDQLDLIVLSLEKAGFKIIQAERINGKLQIEFSWPAPNAPTYVNGWRRAKEVIQPYLPLRQENWAVTKSGEGVNRVAIAIIIKRAEEDPGLWKVKALPMAGNYNANTAWYSVYFNGQQVGEAYMPSFSGGEDMGERLREELAELQQIVPFEPGAWDGKGNAFGSGPAIQWWRKNRSRLSDVRTHENFFDRKLTGE